LLWGILHNVAAIVDHSMALMICRVWRLYLTPWNERHRGLGALGCPSIRADECPLACARLAIRRLIAINIASAYLGKRTGKQRFTMNWINNYVRPRINSIFSRRETPGQSVTEKCENAAHLLFTTARCSDNLNGSFAPAVGHQHWRLTPLRTAFKAVVRRRIFTR